MSRHEARLLAALLVTTAEAAAQDGPAPSPEVSVRLDWPPPGGTVASDRGQAFVAGRAVAWTGGALDLAILVDVSDSTAAPSDLDVDDDGAAEGRPPLSAGRIMDKILRIPDEANADSVLAAELRAVRTLVSRIGCPETRLVLIAFSGDADPLSADASVVVPPTQDRDELDTGLELIDLVGPHGLTNFEAALDTAHGVLVGDGTATPGVRRAQVLLLSDGLPTLPYLGNAKGNSRAAIERASRLAKAGARVDTVAIGKEATDDPATLREMARVGGGVFTSARDAVSLPDVFERLEFSGVDSLGIRNATTARDASSTRRFADGCFGALVPVTEGSNALEVVARGPSGAETRNEFPLAVVAETGPLPRHLMALRDALSEPVTERTE